MVRPSSSLAFASPLISVSVLLGSLLCLHCGSTAETAGAGGGTSVSTSTSSTSATTGAGGGTVCDDPESPAAFEVGTGEKCFDRLTDGQTVPMMQGPQGGFHVWTAVGCTDCGPNERVKFGVKDPATNDWMTGTAAQEVIAQLDPEGFHQTAGLTAFLPGVVWDETTILPKGTPLILSADLENSDGSVKASAEVEVVLGDRETWAPPCDPGPDCGADGGLPCCADGL